ncbi:MAG: hypothetical protein ACRC5C_00895, partial [Bacilli bacterium]
MEASKENRRGCLLAGDYAEDGLEDQLLYHIHTNEQTTMDLLRGSIYGEDGRVMFSNVIVRAIVRSEHPELLEDLSKLLLAAQRQEGVRQAILENMDSGSVEVQRYFMNLIVTHDLIRFSSVVRALDTWTGSGFFNEKPKQLQWIVTQMNELLRDTAACEEALRSGNALSIWLALWAKASVELKDAIVAAHDRIQTGKHVDTRVALHFLKEVANERQQWEIAQSLLSTEDFEILAYISDFLPTGYCSVSDGQRTWEWAGDTYEGCKTTGEREILFQNLHEIVLRIGAKDRTYHGGVFPWSTSTLNNANFFRFMMTIAGYDENRVQIETLFSLRHLMKPYERELFYKYVIHGGQGTFAREKWYGALSDRSSTVREVAFKKLADTGLVIEDVPHLKPLLLSKSASVRKQVQSLLLKLPKEALVQTIKTLLAEKNEAYIKVGL